MKKKLGIVVLLLIIATACFFIGQHNVKKSIFSLSEGLDDICEESGGQRILRLTSENAVEGALRLGGSYVTLTFEYEVDLSDGQDLPSDANLEIDVICPDIPNGRILWAFEPGKMENAGSVTVDLKAFKGKNINIKFTCKGDFPEGTGIILKNIYISKMYV